MRDGRVRFRLLASPAEYAEASLVAKAAWRFPDLMVPPPPDMITATHAGGMTAGAFEGKRLLAFVHAVPRSNLPRPAIHSHLLAVRPEAQGRGLSVLLKLFQREWCLARGIGLVTWTYDPFMVRNARLNLVRLGAVVPAFLPDFYGAIGGIYGDLPSDRFEAHWRLETGRVDRAVRGEPETVAPEEAARLPVARAGAAGRAGVSHGRDDDPRLVARAGTQNAELTPSAKTQNAELTPSGVLPRVVLPFPGGFPGCFRGDLAAGRAARRRFGRTAAALFAAGYEAVSFVERAEGPAYVLARAATAPPRGGRRASQGR